MSGAGEARHVHAEEEIFVILQGKARVRLDDRVEHLTAGDLVVIEPGENHHLEADEQDPCINLHIGCGPRPNHRGTGAVVGHSRGRVGLSSQCLRVDAAGHTGALIHRLGDLVRRRGVSATERGRAVAGTAARSRFSKS